MAITLYLTGQAERKVSPLGALKCNTFPSSLNMLTSSTPVIGCTFNFFSAPWSFLSSCVFEGFDLRTIFRRTVPFPPERALAWRQQSSTHTDAGADANREYADLMSQI